LKIDFIVKQAASLKKKKKKKKKKYRQIVTNCKINTQPICHGFMVIKCPLILN